MQSALRLASSCRVTQQNRRDDKSWPETPSGEQDSAEQASLYIDWTPTIAGRRYTPRQVAAQARDLMAYQGGHQASPAELHSADPA